MSPNAMANQRAAQIAQLKALQSASSTRLKTCDEVLSHLSKAVDSINKIGAIPALSDAHKIADAIKHLALAQIVQIELNITQLKAEGQTLTDAIQQAESPIARVSINN